MLWRIPADTREQRIGTMFNLPTNIRLPGFRVGLPNDPPGQNTETTPGFAVPALGYDPDGNAIQTAQATGLGSASVDPQGLVPVNCTSADGSTNCTTPGGQSFTEPQPQGFPARIAPGNPNYHYYHLQSEPVAIPPERLVQAIIANPTPSFFFGRPATAPLAFWAPFSSAPRSTFSCRDAHGRTSGSRPLPASSSQG
jgi:hypothetical protein